MQIDVSVIIPAYKAEKMLERCVTSLVETGYQNMEILVIEDGSPDGTWDVCKRLEEKYPQVRAIKNPENRGVSYTRNQGLKAAQGTYMMFVDSDDWVAKDFIEIPVNLMKKSQCEMAVFGYVNHDEVHNQSTEEFGWHTGKEYQQVSFEEILLQAYDRRLLQQLWNKVFRTNIIKENQIYFDETSSMGEDFRFILQYLKCCKEQSILLTDQILYHYNRDNENSLMYTFDYKDVEEPLKDMKILYELSGWTKDQVQQKLQEEREKLKTQYAYFIMHSPKYSKKEKKEKIAAIGGKALFRQMEQLFWKEKMAKLLKR